MVADYFVNLFQGQATNYEPIISCVQECISEEKNLNLTDPLSEEELKEALFAMDMDKSLGAYGLNSMFYKRFWNLCAKDVFLACS